MNVFLRQNRMLDFSALIGFFVRIVFIAAIVRYYQLSGLSAAIETVATLL